MDSNAAQSHSLPRHVAIIMDGNGRWAERRGLARSDGHRAGVESLRRVVRAARELGVRHLTLYAFSSENWKRPKSEVDFLMTLPDEYFETELPEAIERGIRIRIIGNPDRLPEAVQSSIERALAQTRDNRDMELTFALSYGGRQEILDAMKKVIRDHEAGGLDPELLDEKAFANYLYDPELPDVDLLIRTGAETRISNFLLWQIAYAELYFTDLLWPEFREKELEEAIHSFQRRERRFGLTSEQIRSRERETG